MTINCRMPLAVSAAALSFLVMSAPITFAQNASTPDAMSHNDTMGKKDTMAKDAMSKDTMGQKDAMGKDAMGKDAMGKDSMKKDQMSK